MDGLFARVFPTTEPKRFSGIGGRFPGLSDKPAGVQWSLWHDHKEDVVQLAVNLEGMADHADWPIGRVIERELGAPSLLHLAGTIVHSDIEVWIGRDVWGPVRGKMRSDDLLSVHLTALTTEKWRHGLTEAREAQGPDGMGRRRQTVVLKSGRTREADVSPHIQFVTPVWSAMPRSHEERLSSLESSRKRLEPLHDFLSQRAAP